MKSSTAGLVLAGVAAYGDRIDLAMEFHGYWNLPCATRIAQALEPLVPMWLEEMLPQDNLAAYRELANRTRLPLTISERLMTRWGFREVLANGAASIIMPDLCWCGGLSEAKKIALMAEVSYLPVAPHRRPCAPSGVGSSGGQSDQPHYP